MSVDAFDRRLAHLHGIDFGPEIRPGSRVMHTQDGRRGMVVQIKARSVDGRTYYDELWRPRSAGVEWDGHRFNPRSGSHQLHWMGPEEIASIPSHWARGVGLVGGTARPAFARSSQTVVRIEVDDLGYYEFVVLKDPARYPGICRRYRSWSELECDWHVVRGEADADEAGPFVHVELGGRREPASTEAA